MSRLIPVLLFLASPFLAQANTEQRFAAEKEREIFERIQKSAYGEKLPPIVSATAWERTSLLDSEYDSKAFTHNGDTMPEGRQKLIHGFGTAVLVSFVPHPNHHYTGLFSAGAPFGILRVSLARPPVYDGAIDLLPGLAIKFFIDGKPSANIMAMPSLDPQSELNIFTHSYTTDLKKPSRSIANWLGEYFFSSALYYARQSGGNPRSLALTHFAAQTSMGEQVSSPVDPYAIVLVPRQELRDLCDKSGKRDFREQLEGNGRGMVLFEVFAKGSPGGNLIAVGTIVARSNFVASEFGDKALFFKHDRVHMPESLDEL